VRSVSRRWCVLALAVSLAGCHRVEFKTHLPKGPEIHEQLLSYWLFGMVGEHEVDLDSICPAGVASWRAESVAWVDLLTLGVYTPRKVVVECAGVKK